MKEKLQEVATAEGNEKIGRKPVEVIVDILEVLEPKQGAG